VLSVPGLKVDHFCWLVGLIILGWFDVEVPLHSFPTNFWTKRLCPHPSIIVTLFQFWCLVKAPLTPPATPLCHVLLALCFVTLFMYCFTLDSSYTFTSSCLAVDKTLH
jgi:hypothetical protein